MREDIIILVISSDMEQFLNLFRFLYFFLAIIYGWQVVADWLAALVLFITFMNLSGILSFRATALINELLLICDAIIKSPLISIDSSTIELDDHCLSDIYNKYELHGDSIIYLCLHVVSGYMCQLCVRRDIKGVSKLWGPLMKQINHYLFPISIYLLSLFSANWYLRITWSVLACLRVFGAFDLYVRVICCLLVALSRSITDIQYTFQLDIYAFNDSNTSLTVATIMALLLLFSNVSSDHHQTTQQQQQLLTRHSTRHRTMLVYQQQQQQASRRWKSKLTLILSMVLCLLTNSIANILILMAVYLNLPNYKAKRFSFLMGMGIIISIVLEPQQIAYFCYLYLIVIIVGSDMYSLHVVQYELYSYDVLLSVYRLYLMLNHVSFLNLVIGLCRSSVVVLFALVIRIACRYLGIVTVFIGTNDNYGLQKPFLNLQALPDAILWVYMVLMCLYSPTATATYSESHLTNMLKQYPLLNRFRVVLYSFRVFNWVSYILFSLLILSQVPSLYIFVQLAALGLMLGIDVFTDEDRPKKSTFLRWLWIFNFYATCCMIFIKYFYLLHQYEQTSQLIQRILEFLASHNTLIGIGEPSAAKSGFGLLLYFLYDGAIAILSSINIYILDFKIYEEYRTIVYRNERLTAPLLHPGQELTAQEQQSLNIESISYFYTSFIKAQPLSSILSLENYELVQKVLRDCLFGFSFTVIVIGFSCECSSSKYLSYFPYFFLAGLHYFLQSTKQSNQSVTNKIFIILAIWAVTNLILWYLAIVAVNYYLERVQPIFQDVFCTYCVTIIVSIASWAYSALPEEECQLGRKNDHILVLLVLPFQIRSVGLRQEILGLCRSLAMAFSFSLFCTNIFSPCLISTFLHPVIFLAIVLVGTYRGSQFNEMYILTLVSLFDIWNTDYIAYFTVLSVSVFYCFDCDTSQQGDQEDQQLLTIQPYYMCYCTIVWLLPIIIDMLCLLGVVWLSPSPISALFILFLFSKFVHQLFSRTFTYTKPVFYATLGFISVFFMFQLHSFYVRQASGDFNLFLRDGFAMFLVYGSYFSYLMIVHRSVWHQQRSTQARQYWDSKSEMVGELGSQLHNEKKMLILERFHHAKKRLSEKVLKISLHLRENGKKPFYSSLDGLKAIEEPVTDYELFSNMLIFLDKQVLIRCFTMLNQYLEHPKGEVQVFQRARDYRAEVLRSYRGSFSEAFVRVKMQHSGPNRQSSGLKASSDSLVDFERFDQINQCYEQCFKLISDSTSEFNPGFRYIVQNMEIISMMLVVGWNFFGGVYSVPTTFAIFGWAMILENKTTVTFWLLTMMYASGVLWLKEIIVYIPDNQVFAFVFYYNSDDYLYEYVVICVSVLQIVFLQLNGIQHQSYWQRESIHDAFYRAALNKASTGAYLDKQQKFMNTYKDLKCPTSHSFVQKVFAKSRFKPGKDFYPLMSGIQLIILLYIFFFYDMIEFESRRNRKSIGQLLTMNQFSSHMVIILFIHIMIMVIDRLLVSVNFVDGANQSLEKFFLEFTYSVGTIKEEPPQALNSIGIFDVMLIIKYLFHVGLLLCINFFVYFYVPSAGLTKSLIPACSQADCSQSYTYLSAFLMLYLLYFMVSSLQIKHGFSRNKCKNVLMEKYHYVNYYIYKAFTAIPFAWEFKKICDWTATSTALPLFHWMKFEDINAKMYESKCEAQMIRMKPLGTPWNKYCLGPAGFLSILFLLFGPILVYSPANPFAVKDTIMGAQIVLSLKMDAKYSYKFYESSHSSVLDNINNEFGVDLTDRNLFLVTLSQYPDQNFGYSEPAVRKLAGYVQQALQVGSHTFEFVIDLTVIEQEGGDSTVQWASKTLSLAELTALHQLLSYKTHKMSVTNLFSPFPGQIPMKTLQIFTNTHEYYQVTLINPKAQSSQSPYFYYLTSNKFKLGVGIVTFYLTYILLISRLLRFYLADSVNSLVYDGCYIQGILSLCEAVREARIVDNFLEEEKFYFELIDIMRHPKILKQITGDFVDFRKKVI